MRTVLAVIALLLTASVAAAQDKPRVVVVNYALQYMAERLLGDSADVVFPVPAGVDPSFWRPSIADISAVQSADLILLNGAGFATWTAKVSLPRSKIVNTARGLEDRFIATATITHSHGDGGTHSHDGTASYLWLDPTLAIAQAEAIAGAVSARGLGDAATVYANLDALRDNLRALDETTKATLGGLTDTVFIATHPRYQYLARAYGLTVYALEWDAGAMPTADQLADLQAKIDETGASVLIWEAAPAKEARAQVANLGLVDLVFPPLAVPTKEAPFLDAFRAGITALADAVAQAENR
ncbi:MAG: zinc ABC transporter substrate-binding protein [Pseudomonadota bacterium]